MKKFEISEFAYLPTTNFSFQQDLNSFKITSNNRGLKFIKAIFPLLIILCGFFLLPNNSNAQCTEPSCKANTPAQGANGPDPCKSKLYCSNSGAVQTGLISCTHAADTDGCGISADAAHSAQSLYSNADATVTELFSGNECNTGKYLQWIVFATPPTVAGTKIQGVGAVDSWWLFHAGSVLIDPAGLCGNAVPSAPWYDAACIYEYPTIDAATKNRPRCNNFNSQDLVTCSNANQYKSYLDDNADIGEDLYNIYYIALFWNTPTNGTLNFKVKECQIVPCIPFTTTVPNDVNEVSCKTQTNINASFQTFLNGFSAKGTASQNPVITWYVNGNPQATKPTVSSAPDACGGSVLIKYMIEDDCNLPIMCQATFTVKADTEKPVISVATSADPAGECNPTEIIPPTFTGMDNCLDATFSVPAMSTGATNDGCAWTQTWTGNYTDACLNIGDQASVTYTWYVAPDITLSISADLNPICESRTAMITATATGGCGELQYLWSDGQTTATIETQPLFTTSVYSVTVTDEFGCVVKVASITIETVDCCSSETAFAAALTPAGNLNTNISECFIDKPKGNGNSMRWGWTNGPFMPSGVKQRYSLSLIAGAGRCNLESGTKVGKVDLVIKTNGDIMVNYLVPDNSQDPNFDIYATLGSVHLYIGCEELPKKLAPGQFPFKGNATLTNINGQDYWQVSFTIAKGKYNACNNGKFYLIAHAEVEVCDKVPDSGVLPALKIMDNKIHTVEINENTETRSDPRITKFEVFTYPNPTNDVLTVDLKGLQNEKTFIRIHDLVGKLIKEIEVDPLLDTKLKLNLSDELKTGMYYLHVNNGDKHIVKPVIVIE